MSIETISARAGVAAVLCAALLAFALRSPAFSQEPAWAPLPPPTASRSPASPRRPLLGREPVFPSIETAPAQANGVPRAFDLPTAMPPAASPVTEPLETDWTPQLAAPGPMEFAQNAPVTCPTICGETDRRWRSLFTQPARTPWLAQPLSISKFAGGYGSDEPIEDRLHTGIGLLTGVRTCWDFAPRWGIESRLGFARTSLGTPAPGQLVSHENFWFWDAEFVFYPWPDTLWRPFIFAGTGMTDVRYIDDVGRSLHQSLFHMPFGIGVKRQIYGEHAFRIDISDNLLFTDTRPREYVHGVSIAAGFEFRFGGRWKWLRSLPTE